MSDTPIDPETAAWLAAKEREAAEKKRAAFAALEALADAPGVSMPDPDEPPLGPWTNS